MSNKNDDDSDWETDERSTELGGTGAAVPPLLPAPTNLASHMDRLCDVCKRLQLTAERFVVRPRDVEKWNQPDKPNIELGLVEDILKKTSCPFCRLIIVALGGSEVPSVEDGVPVCVVMSWSTNGPIPDPNAPWNHIPQVRVLRPYARKLGGGYVRSTRLNMFPEITLLANDSPVPSTTYFVRPIFQDKIDFGMVRNWISMCKSLHGQGCNKAKMLEHEAGHPADVIPAFRFIDVVDNCLVRGVSNTQYATLSYVWGRVDFFRTLKNNVGELEQPGALKLPEFHEKIPWTIRDAMQVVQEIGLRYLWVDSLCIVQDNDPGEMLEAVSKMDLVYGAAFLMITAASGPNADAGLPGVRPGTREDRQAIEEIMPGLRLAFKPTYQNHIKDCVYYTRGWTFQELFFSRRSLVFIGGQVVFRCHNSDQWREDVVFEDDSTIREEHPREHERTDDIGELEGLIQSYSGLTLTYNSDIYFAFAGIARYITLELKTNLCHGIPEAYFDWFLLWTSLQLQTRRKGLPSWSWSGWFGESWPRIWDWYSRDIKKIRRAQKKRTWIIWYQRMAHDSVECSLVWTHDKPSSASSLRNFYGGRIQDRFSLDCTKSIPTPRMLANAPPYCKDTLNPSPKTGFLQFWTVSVTFRLDLPASPSKDDGPENLNSRVAIFGQSNRELGIIFVTEDWRSNHVPGDHEFILLCEGRDERAEGGREDDEDGWKYMVMLLEWHGEWAERVAVGSIEKDVDEALGEGPVWKEIILG